MPQGIGTPVVGALPRGDKTPGVDTKGDRVTGEEGRWRGGDRNPPTTRASDDSWADGGNDGMVRKLRTAPPPCPSDTAAEKDSTGPLLRQSDGADGARSKNGMRPRREYNLLALEVPEGGQANAWPSTRGDSRGSTRETSELGRSETPTEAETRQRALQARGWQEDGGKQQSPLTGRVRLMRAAYQGGKEGGEPSPRSMRQRRATRGRRGPPGGRRQGADPP